MAVRRIALTRAVSSALERCELTHLERQPIDLGRARAQHAAYEAALEALGCEVVRLPEEPELPDSVFVEDTALVLDEIAILTRPGAESRRAETAAVREALAAWRPLAGLAAPATLDGGDVLRVGRRLYVGSSTRSNAAGIAQLQALVEPLGYTVEGVPIQGCLHLKSAVTEVGPGLLLLNAAWVNPRAFTDCGVLEVHRDEPFAANALRIGDVLLFPQAFPRTRARLEKHGLAVRTVDVSELAKAEGAVTCCSLIVELSDVSRS